VFDAPLCEDLLAIELDRRSRRQLDSYLEAEEDVGARPIIVGDGSLKFEFPNSTERRAVMWKFPLVVGGAVGFVLGSRAGRGPYEQLENRVRQLRGRPWVQGVTNPVGESTKRVTDQVTRRSSQVGDAGAEVLSLAADQADVVTSEAVNSVANQATDIVGKAADQFDNGLPIRDYDELTATEIISKLGSLSQVDLAKVDGYERKNANRSTITDRTTSLRAEEPWPGYDEQTVVEIRGVLTAGDGALSRKVHDYERRHKDRQGVLDATDKARLSAT
jgi:hypothetical protein